MKRTLVLLAIILVLSQLATTQNLNLPPLSWTCPMHPDIVETHEGQCPICGMDLKAVRLDQIWMCPVHSIVEETRPGKCPICRRELAPVNVALSFTCTNHPDVDDVNPGMCPDNSARVPKRTLRSHGNHNPQHGGVFFMAPDNWHHLEGTYPQEGQFRLYVYDDFAKPLAIDRLKEAAGRVVTKEVFDNATQQMREVTLFPIEVAADGRYLEAKIDRLEMPAEMIAKIKFKPDGEEYRFDFVFPEFSNDREVAAGPSLTTIEIPDNTVEILRLLAEQSTAIRDLIQKGAFGEIYVPAFQAKDLALALDLRVKELASERRAGATAAITQVVRSAWQLDAYGDQGNRELIQQTYETFARSVEQLQSAFSSGRL